MAVDPITYAAKQRRVADVAAESLLAWIAENPGAGLDEIREQVMILASMYGDAAAELAIEYYMDARSAIDGIVEWEPEPYEGLTDATMTRLISEQYDPDDAMRGMLDLINVAVQQAGRNTVAKNARHDPGQARWARMPVGKTCAFCLMLASRGAVYFTKQKAGGTGSGTNWYHASCDCQPVPVWPGQKPPYDADELYDMYRRAADRADGSSAEAIAAQMRRDYPDMVTDGVTPRSTGTGSPGGSRPKRKLPEVFQDPPFVLLGGSPDWPADLDPVTEERWKHILDDHGPASTKGKPRFDPGTDIGTAVFDTLTRGSLVMDLPDRKVWSLVVNGQTVSVALRWRDDHWFIASAYPDQ